MRRDGCGLTTIANECAAVAIEVPLVSLLPLLAIAVLYRYGLLASISAMFVWHLWVFFPMTTERSTSPSRWQFWLPWWPTVSIRVWRGRRCSAESCSRTELLELIALSTDCLCGWFEAIAAGLLSR